MGTCVGSIRICLRVIRIWGVLLLDKNDNCHYSLGNRHDLSVSFLFVVIFSELCLRKY